MLGSSLASLRCSTILVIESIVPFLHCEVSVLVYSFGASSEVRENVHLKIAADEELARHDCDYRGLMKVNMWLLWYLG